MLQQIYLWLMNQGAEETWEMANSTSRRSEIESSALHSPISKEVSH